MFWRHWERQDWELVAPFLLFGGLMGLLCLMALWPVLFAAALVIPLLIVLLAIPVAISKRLFGGRGLLLPCVLGLPVGGCVGYQDWSDYQIRHRGDQIVAAIERFRAEHGHYPGSLEADGVKEVVERLEINCFYSGTTDGFLLEVHERGDAFITFTYLSGEAYWIRDSHEF
jgi:hypothetical protein